METASGTDSGLSRRQFMRAAGVLTGAGLASGLAWAQQPAASRTGIGHTAANQSTASLSAAGTSAKKVRIGIVGGRFGTTFFWHEHPNCIVEAVSDLIPERRKTLMETYKCGKSYPSLEELILDKNIDAVGVYTGAPDHVRHAVACLKAGKHVISAVPAGLTVEECEELLDTVNKTGLTYMMCETSWYHQSVITARQWYKEGKFGRIFSVEAEYHHPGLEELYFEDGKPTWRHGLAPMNYPTHCTGYLVGVTGERMTQVSCIGWGDDSPKLKGNAYNNPFWNETAFFKTDKDNAFRVGIFWKGPVGGCERGQWYGEKMSFFDPTSNGLGPIVRRMDTVTEKDDGGFVRQLAKYEKFDQPEYYKTDMLPEPLRHPSGHGGSHTFLTHEFIDALVNGRRPSVDIYEALAMTVPGIVAHQSALQGGKQLPIPVYERKA